MTDAFQATAAYLEAEGLSDSNVVQRAVESALLEVRKVQEQRRDSEVMTADINGTASRLQGRRSPEDAMLKARLSPPHGMSMATNIETLLNNAASGNTTTLHQRQPLKRHTMRLDGQDALVMTREALRNVPKTSADHARMAKEQVKRASNVAKKHTRASLAEKQDCRTEIEPEKSIDQYLDITLAAPRSLVEKSKSLLRDLNHLAGPPFSAPATLRPRIRVPTPPLLPRPPRLPELNDAEIMNAHLDKTYLAAQAALQTDLPASSSNVDMATFDHWLGIKPLVDQSTEPLQDDPVQRKASPAKANPKPKNTNKRNKKRTHDVVLPTADNNSASEVLKPSSPNKPRRTANPEGGSSRRAYGKSRLPASSPTSGENWTPSRGLSANVSTDPGVDATPRPSKTPGDDHLVTAINNEKPVTPAPVEKANDTAMETPSWAGLTPEDVQLQLQQQTDSDIDELSSSQPIQLTTFSPIQLLPPATTPLMPRHTFDKTALSALCDAHKAVASVSGGFNPTVTADATMTEAATNQQILLTPVSQVRIAAMAEESPSNSQLARMYLNLSPAEPEIPPSVVSAFENADDAVMQNQSAAQDSHEVRQVDFDPVHQSSDQRTSHLRSRGASEAFSQAPKDDVVPNVTAAPNISSPPLGIDADETIPSQITITYPQPPIPEIALSQETFEIAGQASPPGVESPRAVPMLCNRLGAAPARAAAPYSGSVLNIAGLSLVDLAMSRKRKKEDKKQARDAMAVDARTSPPSGKFHLEEFLGLRAQQNNSNARLPLANIIKVPQAQAEKRRLAAEIEQERAAKRLRIQQGGAASPARGVQLNASNADTAMHQNADPLFCFGSTRLLQNHLVSRALDDCSVELAFPDETHNPHRGMTAADADICDLYNTCEPDIILSATACAILYRRDRLYKLACFRDAHNDEIKSSHWKLLLHIIERLLLRFDAIHILLETYDAAAAVVTAQASMVASLPAMTRAMGSLSQHIAQLRTQSLNTRGVAIDIEVQTVNHPAEAALYLRQRVDPRLGSDPSLGQMGGSLHEWPELPLNKLTLQQIVVMAGSVEDFLSMPQRDRHQLFGNMLGQFRLACIDQWIKANNLPVQTTFAEQGYGGQYDMTYY